MPRLLLRDFVTQAGQMADELVLSYRTHGVLDAEGDNVVVVPTPFGATHADLEWLVGPDGLLDASRHFVVIVDTFGNGWSTSPVEILGPVPTRTGAPVLSTLDNVRAQRLLLRELGIRRVKLVFGWSMGGQQAYQWAAAYPEMVARICVICGSARTSAHNHVFLEGLRASVELMSKAQGDPEAVRIACMRALGRMYAGWALSQDFYRAEVWRELGYETLEEFLVGYWEQSFVGRHPANVLAQIATWQSTDIGRTWGPAVPLAEALGRIEARVLLMPCRQDLYFRVEDSKIERRHLAHCTLQVIDSPWGHRAGMPRHSPADRALIRSALSNFLDA